MIKNWYCLIRSLPSELIIGIHSRADEADELPRYIQLQQMIVEQSVRIT